MRYINLHFTYLLIIYLLYLLMFIFWMILVLTQLYEGGNVQIAVFSLLQSRIQAFIFHRTPATPVLFLTWVVSSSLQPLQMTTLLTRRIIILARCVRVAHRAVLDPDTTGHVPDPSHWFSIRLLTPSIRLFCLYFNSISCVQMIRKGAFFSRCLEQSKLSDGWRLLTWLPDITEVTERWRYRLISKTH